MKNEHEVIFFDLWFTIIHGLTTDPVLTLQRMLSGNPAAEMNEGFLTSCLTLDIKQPAHFLKRVAKEHGYEPAADATANFRALLKDVSKAAAKFPETDAVLSELKRRGYRLGLISNLWPFGVNQFFGEHKMGLGAYFEHLIYSYEAGYRKPSPEIFLSACRRFDVDPSRCLMVGDNLEADVKASLSVGMKARLVARKGCADRLPAGARAIGSLTELLV